VLEVGPFILQRSDCSDGKLGAAPRDDRHDQCRGNLALPRGTRHRAGTIRRAGSLRRVQSGSLSTSATQRLNLCADFGDP
jgi:hypothetical protein